MKKFLLLPLLCMAVAANSQLLTWTPDFIKEASNPVTITTDANFGNKGLLNYTPTTDVYVHIGVITNKSTSSSDWKHVPFAWGTTNAAAQCTYLGANKWRFTINGGLRSFFSVTDPTETIQKIAILFRTSNGSKKQANADGTDMYVPVYDNGVHARIDIPYKQPTYVPVPEPVTKIVGDALSITAKANTADTLSIFLNGNLLGTVKAASLSVNTTIAVSGNQQIIAESKNGALRSRDTMNILVAPANNIADLPPGAVDGINYEPGDTSAILVLYAPEKTNVFLLGDFNNWATLPGYLMNITPDAARYWIRLTGLTPGTEYAYQYLFDGSLKVADYNTEKVLDPANDQYIPAATYPNLKAYPTGKTTGIVSILQTAKPAYNWQAPGFVKPNKQNLVIYELLVRDFIAAQNWQTLRDTLSYLKRLGVNAIEVMPFNEFEGNSSWGYNPSFFLAPDKAYGTETALKQFIDECHKQGMAVVMDIVLNHTYGSPMVEMYWDAANNRPAANNPWYNAVAPTSFGFGNDFNHESAATKSFFNRVLAHWVSKYRIDGYRFDFSKGLTQKISTNDAAFAAYDASRIAIIKNYAAIVRGVDAGAYIILEHFCDNTEEKELSDNNGMMLWGNGNYNFMEATMGWVGTSDFSGIIHTTKGWAQPNLVGYMESHDEERTMYKNLKYGNSSGAYNVRDTAVALKRNGMAAAFWAMIPGPKLMWEFQELGYDYSRCYLATNGEDGDCNTKLDPKPIKWNYYNEPRRKALYDVYVKLFKLRATPNYLSTFTTGMIDTLGFNKAIKCLNVFDDSLKVVVYGNFDVKTVTGNIKFPSTGTWYSFLNDSVATVGATTVSVTLPPGAYYVFTNKDIKDAVLPVSLLNFTAQKTGRQNVQLKWSTSSELNNQYFEVQRSGNGSAFTTIGRVNAQATQSSVKQYSFTDNMAGSVNYYRLKQVDKDGASRNSAVIKISLDGGVQWRLYPNPAKGSTVLYMQDDAAGLQVTLTDMSGKIVYYSTIKTAVSGQQIPIPVGNLAKGLYMLKIQSNGVSSTEKLIVQ